jgi:hypothetical protein
MGFEHRLNMELDLKSLFGLNVHFCTHWLRPRNLLRFKIENGWLMEPDKVRMTTPLLLLISYAAHPCLLLYSILHVHTQIE